MATIDILVMKRADDARHQRHILFVLHDVV